MIITKINEILEDQKNRQLTKESYFCTPSKANKIIGDLKNNYIWSFFIIPQDLNIDLNGSTYNISGNNFTIYFLTPQEKLDFDGCENLEKQERCLGVATDFLYYLKQEKDINITSENLSTTLMYSVNDRTCCGIKLTLSIKEKQPNCLSPVDNSVFIDVVTSNPTTESINLKIVFETGLHSIIKKGVYYSVATDPEIIPENEIIFLEDEKTIYGLTSDTTYYFKPFIETEDGVTYGEVKGLKTKVEEVILVTSEANDIGENNATLNGVIYSAKEISECGFVYSNTPNPTIEDSKIECTIIDNEIQAEVEELTENTLYYYRTYAIIDGEDNYGDTETFTTQLINPLLVTDPATNITIDGFTANGLIFDYNRPLLEMGVVYGSNQYPVIGIGDAVKVTIDELDSYRFHKTISGVTGDNDLYCRTFGAKQNGTTIYTLNSELCHRALYCEFYDWLNVRTGSTIGVNLNLKFHRDKYMYIKNFRSVPNCAWELHYNNKRFYNQFLYSSIYYYDTGGYTVGGLSRTTPWVPLEYELKDYYVYANGVQIKYCNTTAPEYLVENAKVKFTKIEVGDRLYTLINAEKKNEDGTYENMYVHLMPAKLLYDIPASKSLNNEPQLVGTVGFYEEVTGKFWPMPGSEVGND